MTGPGALVAGRYRLRSQLGGGGMGAVWLARDELLGRDVAVKQVLVPVGIDEALAQANRDAAMREGRIAARLSHPHAVGVYDMVLDQGQPWLVMEYLPSVSLADLLRDRGVLPIAQVAQIGAQVADALAATHDAGVIHRDVKPGNILIGQGPGREGVVKITDFGISRAVGDVSLTQTGVVKGTPAFLAPEVAQGASPDEASDVFSLGATLYACLEGTPPFGLSDNALQMLHKVAGGDFTPPSQAGALTAPLMRMLAADPSERPTMMQVRDELAKLAAGPDKDVTEVLTARTLLPRTLPEMPSRSKPQKTSVEKVTIPPPTPEQVAAAEVPMAPPPPEPVAAAGPASDPAGSPSRGRGRWAAVLAAVLVVGVLAALLVVWLNRPDGGTEATADDPPASSAPTPSPSEVSAAPEPSAPATSAEPPSPATTTSEPPPPTTEVPDGPPTAAEMEQFVVDYYSLLPADPDAAYQRTGPTLRDISSPGDYRAFWRLFQEVTIGDVRAVEGELVVNAAITFIENDGDTFPEQHRIELVEGPDGQLLVDSDVAV